MSQAAGLAAARFAEMPNASAVESWRSDSFTTVSLAAILVLAVVLCFSNGASGPFVMDDHGNIVGNEGLDSFFPDPTRSRLGLRRAIGHMSFALNYRLGGLNVKGFHWLNIAIHALATLVVFGIVRRTLELDSIDQRFRSASTWIGFSVALLWALHPLQTASVTYIVQRLEAMMGLFYFLTLYCMLRGATCPRKQRTRLWYAAGVVAFSLGIGSKEVIATAPIVLLLFDRVFLSETWKDVLGRRWGFYLSLLPALIWLAYLISPAYDNPFPGKSGVEGASVTAWEYVRSQSGVILHYLRLVVWPVGLCFDYAWPVATSWQAIVLPGALIVAMIAASITALWWLPWVGFLSVSFFLILAPTSSIMPIKDLCFDHRMYVPLAPITILLVACLYAWILRRVPQRHRRTAATRDSRWTLVGVCSVLSLVLGILTIQRNQDYQSLFSIWSDTVTKAQHNTRAHVNLGNAYLGQAHRMIPGTDEATAAYVRARDCYSQAIRISPTDAMAFNNRGRVHSELKNTELALADFSRAIELNPGSARALHNRGTLYADMNEYERAVADLTRAIDLKPNGAPDSLLTRGSALFNLRRFAEAADDFSRALELDPSSWETMINRGNTYRIMKRYGDAIRDLTAALDLQPNQIDALRARSRCYFHTREFAAALSDAQRIGQLGGTVDERFMKALNEAIRRAD